MTGGGGVVREENTNEESTLYSLTIVSLHSSLHPTHTIHHTLHHVLCFFLLSASFVLPFISSVRHYIVTGGKPNKGTKRSGECVLFVSLCSYWLICNGMRVKHEISQVNKEETKHTQFLVLFLFPLWLCSFRASLAFHYKWTKPKGKKNEEPEKTWNVV